MLRPATNPTIRALIVDDTRTIRAMIRALLLRDPRIEVVGEACDPYEAREMIRSLNPDVITLDVVMPKMDGISFLERLMRLRPMPVVMVSSRTTENSSAAIQALSLGAFDCVDIAALSRGQSNVELAEVVVAAASSNPRGQATQRRPQSRIPEQRLNWNGRIVVIGSSTGGVDALTTVLSGFPKDCPPTLIAQHMPPDFLNNFCARLDRTMAPKVGLAKDGAKLEQGRVVFAPGGDWHLALSECPERQMTLVPNDGSELYVPSVNVLFSSAVYHAPKIVAVMLTGMGKDGAEPMLKLRKAGAYTIAQDGPSAVVDGMPRAARDIGAAIEVASLNNIAAAVLAQVAKPKQEKTG
ncbi:chemotaxis-specific protein-glutamate methyltransferase CheB [Rhodobacteraceae bacterium]|nr:chemotaxis-specific protein-glutamate methyltransferase CheB [Paracoccaceae bacterium]